MYHFVSRIINVIKLPNPSPATKIPEAPSSSTETSVGIPAGSQLPAQEAPDESVSSEVVVSAPGIRSILFINLIRAIDIQTQMCLKK